MLNKETDKEEIIELVYEKLSTIKTFSRLPFQDLKIIKQIIVLLVNDIFNKKLSDITDKMANNCQEYIQKTVIPSIYNELNDNLEKYADQILSVLENELQEIKQDQDVDKDNSDEDFNTYMFLNTPNFSFAQKEYLLKYYKKILKNIPDENVKKNLYDNAIKYINSKENNNVYDKVPTSSEEYNDNSSLSAMKQVLNKNTNNNGYINNIEDNEKNNQLLNWYNKINQTTMGRNFTPSY